ncbi:MAG TPA: SpoIIE family protein phosphatase [Candidatus Saccharimonadia bacterium]|nr:SpoIIE family protein phosphatase [Candidatus Saccharimonadia bacterium]
MKDKASYLSETSPSVLVPSPLFADLDGETITLIVAQLTEEVWPAGHIVFEEYAPGDTLYIIVDGQVQISRTFQNGAQRVIRAMGPGEFFGEMALLEDTPRSARVSTVTATTLLAVTRQRFNTLIEQHPAVAINFLKAISAQLRQQYQEQAILLQEKQTLVEALAVKNAALEQALAELRAALVTVAEHERVQRDLEIAREIQQQMLPATFPQTLGLRLHATTVPATWVGGDLYDAIRLDSDRVGLLLGDVSGKGIPAALQMARLMGEFRACVSHCADPQSVMQVLNGLLCQRNLRFGSFVTVQYVVLDVRQRHMQFICAGHPPILLRHTDGQIEHLGVAPNIPLGVEETFAYHQEERQLMAGDTLLLYSDGTYERQDIHGVQLGLSRLACLFAAAPSYPEAVVPAIQAALTTFSDVEGAKDDTTLLCAQIL